MAWLTCSHDDFWFEDGDFDFFVGKNLGAVDVQLVADVDILAKHTHVLHADPGANGGMPPVNTCPLTMLENSMQDAVVERLKCVGPPEPLMKNIYFLEYLLARHENLPNEIPDS